MNLKTEDKFKKIAHHKAIIHQGYLFASKGISLRCRKVESKKTSFYLTLKSSVGGRCVEIENLIDERDFNDLWSQCMNKLEKIRYFIYDKNNVWEVDFFKDHNQENYFCLAEFEIKEADAVLGAMPIFHKNIPNFIKEDLLHEVELTDCKFSSKLLADIRYATKLYNDIKESSNEKLQTGKHTSCS